MRIYGIIKKYEKKNETFNQRSINFIKHFIYLTTK